jgi:KDO2-lipid IV(A) lauroyltransferase
MLLIFIKIFQQFLGCVDIKRAAKLGAFLGLVWFYFIRIRRRTVFFNLKLALPQKADEHKKIAKCTYASTGMNFTELLHIYSKPVSCINGYMEIKGWENYKDAKALNKGVIVVTGHFGNFDLLACSQGANGVPLAILSKNLSNDSLNRYWMNLRERYGVKIFKSEDSRSVLKWLKAGNVLGLVTDQRISLKNGGVLVPFFTKKVWTSPAAAKLAFHTGAVLLPVVSKRVGPGQHVMTIGKPIIPAVDNLGNFEIIETMTLINKQIEEWILADPCSWMWLHKRFKNSL